SPPFDVVMLNQRAPSLSRVMPCVLAASPPGFGTARNFTAPVLVSMRPMVSALFGVFDVNHRLPSRSDHASCTGAPMREGVPSDQSCPSLGRAGAAASADTSYSRPTTRAASPLGRGGSLIFMVLS